LDLKTFPTLVVSFHANSENRQANSEDSFIFNPLSSTNSIFEIHSTLFETVSKTHCKPMV
jgi:hypothetical protein